MPLFGSAPPAAEFESEAIVWVSDREEVWRPGQVKDVSAKEYKVEMIRTDNTDDGDDQEIEVVTIPYGKGANGKNAPKMLRRNTVLVGDGAIHFDDLTDVPELHEAAVLHALSVRFSHGIIYTFTGPVLLAVNPFRALPGLYGPETLRGFFDSGGEEQQKAIKPHVFGIAARALRDIRENNRSQTVLISGESGAGKTETTKFVMQFLALAGTETGSSDPTSGIPSRVRSSSSISPARGRASSGVLSHIERKVLGSNPLLEAFGNAKTTRNDNSSRFGKYIELQFGTERPNLPVAAAPRLVGARIHTYLLEKVRVTGQLEGERSFHIFYQALAAAQTPMRLAAAGSCIDEEMDIDLSGFTGRSVKDFVYLETTQDVTVSESNAMEDFESTLAAMRSIGLGVHETSDLFRTLAGVLHLGNIQFAPLDSESSEVSTGSRGAETAKTEQPLEITCELLGVFPADLSCALCSRTMQAPGERAIRMNNNVQKAADSRDALARHLYHAIFKHVVQLTNMSIGFQDDVKFCGVLDIFGFEFFEKNSFEQLCINYTNELLQQYFNSFIFENEASLYREEGIPWQPQDFPDNSAIVSLLHSKITGILPMLEEECFNVGGTSESWQRKLVRQHKKHPNFEVPRLKQMCFVVQHFAGPVTYDAEGFLDKNRDQLSPELLQCLQGSTRPFVRRRFLEHDRVFGTGQRKGGGLFAESGASQKVMKAQRYSVSSEFRQQLHDLMSQIRTTVPHFIRCIKPNHKNLPFEDSMSQKPLFNRPAVNEQLSYQGVLEAIRVARAGFPVRLTHDDFFKEFRCLAARDHRIHLEAKVRQAGSAGVAEVRTLLENRKFQALLASSDSSSSDVMTWAIGKTRVFLKQEPCNALRAERARLRHTSVQLIQAGVRCRYARLRFVRFRRAVQRLQAMARGGAIRGELWRQKREQMAIVMETSLRTLLARHHFHVSRWIIIKMQSWARMRWCRTRFLANRGRFIQVQRWWRSVTKRRRWRYLHQSVLRLQRAWRGKLGRREALELRVVTHRLRMALRALVRMRRRNLAHRAWREKMMAVYHRPKWPAVAQKAVCISDLLKLHEEVEGKRAIVQQLRAEKQALQLHLQPVPVHA